MTNNPSIESEESEVFSRSWIEQQVLEAMIGEAVELGEAGTAVVILFDAIIQSIDKIKKLSEEQIELLAAGSFESLYQELVQILGEGFTIAFLNVIQMASVGKMERVPDGSRGLDDPGSHYTAFALGKAMQSFRTGQDSTEKPDTADGKVRRGESPTGGAVVGARKRIITAFSGAPLAETDVRISEAGVRRFEEIAALQEQRLSELRANPVHGEWSAEHRMRHDGAGEQKYLGKALRALERIGEKSGIPSYFEKIEDGLSKEETRDLFNWTLSHIPKSRDFTSEQILRFIQPFHIENSKHEFNRFAESRGYTQLINANLGEFVPALIFIFSKEDKQELVSALALPGTFEEYERGDRSARQRLLAYQMWFVTSMIFYSHATDGDYHDSLDETTLSQCRDFVLRNLGSK